MIAYCARALYSLIHALILARLLFLMNDDSGSNNEQLNFYRGAPWKPKNWRPLFAFSIIGLIGVFDSTCQLFPMVSEHQTCYRHPVFAMKTIYPHHFYRHNRNVKALIYSWTLIFKCLSEQRTLVCHWMLITPSKFAYIWCEW